MPLSYTSLHELIAADNIIIQLYILIHSDAFIYFSVSTQDIRDIFTKQRDKDVKSQPKFLFLLREKIFRYCILNTTKVKIRQIIYCEPEGRASKLVTVV